MRALPFLALLAALALADPYQRMKFPNEPGLALFDQSKLGLFIHWGPVSQWGTEISFPLACGAFPCDVRGPNNTVRTLHNASELAAHRGEYAALARTFNPTLFDAPALAALARGAGFRYVTYTAEHCDGFSGWNASQNRNYSAVTTPFARDIVGEVLSAFRAAGLRAGVYVCPSTWNNNLYWAPDAATAFGGCCSPNYDPLASPENSVRWGAYVAYLHTQVRELIEGYAPDHFWFDSGTTPPSIDTRLEELAPAIRAANPTAVYHVRDGGVWHDYIEPNDHTEAIVGAILGLSYARAGDKFEVPGTLGEQWAFDPQATYKSAATVIKDLIGIVAKGGNYLMNIGLDSTGVWAPQALVTLANMTSWFAFAGEAIHNTTPTWPYAYGSGYTPDPTLWFTASASATYVFFFAQPPNGTLLIPPFKPSTLAAPPTAVSRLTPAGPRALAFDLGNKGLGVAVGALPGAGLIPFATYFKRYSGALVDNAPCGARDCGVYTQAGYAAAGHEGGCLTPAGAAAAGEAVVPLNLWFNGATDNPAGPAPPADGQSWQRVDSECSAFRDGKGADRWPLELWHSAALGDWWALASPASRSAAKSRGYTLNETIGWLAAETTPEPSVESYAYVLKVEW